METNQHAVRNYASMTKELEELNALFDKKTMSEAAYIQTRDKILQDMHDYKYRKTGFKNYIKTKNINVVKTVINGIATLFGLVGLVFAILPMEYFGLASLGISVGLAVISFILFRKDKKNNFFKYLIIAALVIALFAIGKLIFIKNEVAKDKQFEQTIQKSQQEDLKELEGLE